jgi:Tfp pilus assembly protein PilO
MTGRDRIVVMVVVVLAVLGGAWVMVVSPERKQATKLDAQVTAAKAQLESAESQLNSARAAQAQYAAAYSSIVSLGKAVPAGQEVPSLIYELSHATHQQNVEFASIASPTAATTPAIGAAAGATGVAAAAFASMPFTFVFNGSFFSLEHLFKTLTGFTNRTSSDALKVSGRLLTIQSVKLAPQAEAAQGTASKGRLSGTITATAYQLPAGQGVTGGATPSSPAGAGAAPASTTASTSATTAPAIARVTP